MRQAWRENPPPVELEVAYRLAAARLRSVGERPVALRFERRASELAVPGAFLAGRCIPAAIRYAIDAGGARIAARLDPGSAPMWRAIAEDQSRMASSALLNAGTRGG